MSLTLAIVVAVGSGGIAGLILQVILRRINPATVQGYRPCAGGWHEAHLNGCAAGLTHVPQQPINTYTNLAYLSGGLVAVYDLFIPAAYPFALASLYLCVGSALYHATSTRWAGILDVSGIYAVFTALAAYALGTLVGLSGGWTAGLMLITSAAAAYFLRRLRNQEMQLIIGICVATIYVLILLCMWIRRDWSLLWPVLILSFVLFAVAFIIWNLDKRQRFPLAGWGHGIWHLLTAAAIAMLFYTIRGIR